MAVPVEIKSLVHYPCAYFKSLNAIIRNGYKNDDDKRTRDIIETFELIDSNDNPEVRILAIGPGPGMSDKVILDVVSARFKAIVYVVIEPIKTELQKFKDLVTLKTEQDQWKNVHFEYHCTTIEEYLDVYDSDVHGGFHAIHALHCVYHFRYPHGILIQLYEILLKHGVLFVMLTTGQWEKIYDKVGEYYFDPKMHFFGLSTVRKKFEERIKDAKIITKYRANMFPINKCFEEDSAEGNDILDFLTQIPDFRKTTPEEIAREILSIIKDNCQRSGSDLMFGGDDEDMVVIKT